MGLLGKTIILPLSIIFILVICAAGCKKQDNGNTLPDIQLPIVDFPVLAWYGLNADMSNYAKFKELKSAGFNINLSIAAQGFFSVNKVETALNEAQKAGVKVIIDCPELYSDPEAVAEKFKNHPAMGGYFIADEPNISSFNDFVIKINKIKAIDSTHMFYINLWPFGSGVDNLGVPDYSQYIETFIQQLDLPTLSFDNYPVRGHYSVDKKWFQNLEILRDLCKKYNKNLWAFALSVGFGSHYPPELSHLRLQMFCNLAYGAQGLQYFTYTTPVLEDFNNAPLDDSGRRTGTYTVVKQMNQEISNLSSIFLGAVVDKVRHAGENIPPATIPLTPTDLPDVIKTLDPGKGSIVVSFLKNGSANYLLVVNKDLANVETLKFKADPIVRKVINDKGIVSGTPIPFEIIIEPGDAAIFTW